jgi:hypothetical protein
MAITEIPKKYVYTCDACGFEHVQENALGHYSNSRPPRWANLTFSRDALDYHGAPVADGTVKLLLCASCHGRAAIMLNSLKPEAAHD